MTTPATKLLSAEELKAKAITEAANKAWNFTTVDGSFAAAFSRHLAERGYHIAALTPTATAEVERLAEAWKNAAVTEAQCGFEGMPTQEANILRDSVVKTEAAFRTALAALRSVPEGWRPIETAPKDAPIICCCEGFLPFEAEWDRSYGQFVAASGHDLRPTHWWPMPPRMPLPAAPKAK